MKPSSLLSLVNRFFIPEFQKYGIGVVSGNIGISKKDLILECLSRCKELWILIEDGKSGDESSNKIREVYSIEGVERVLMYKREKDLIHMMSEISPDIRFLERDWEGKAYPGFEFNIPVHYLDF